VGVEGEWRGGIQPMYFMYLYKDRTINPVEVILSRVGR
jgi:hypothetical protein